MAVIYLHGCTLKDVTINEPRSGVYGIWICENGQNITIDGLNLTAERGIKIADEDANKEAVTLNIANAEFTTKKKAAILTTVSDGATINAGEGINIANVTADTENLVWVDEERAEEYYKVTTTDAKMTPETKESDYTNTSF